MEYFFYFINFLLIILEINLISCLNNFYNFEGNFDAKHLLGECVTPENNILIYNPNDSTLYKYMMEPNTGMYRHYKKLNYKNFPKDSNENENICFHFEYVNYSTINITYFNEKYVSYYIYNANKDGDKYEHISLEVLSDNKLILFLNDINSYQSYINEVEFDYQNEVKLKILNTYKADISKKKANCYCSYSTDKDIICGLIELTTDKSTNKFEYSLTVLQNRTTSLIKKSVASYTTNDVEIDSNSHFFVHQFDKLITLDNNRILIIINSYDIFYVLIHIISSDIYINTQYHATIFDNALGTTPYLKRNILSAIQVGEYEVLVSCFIIKDYTYILAYAKIFENNVHRIESKYSDYSYSSLNYLHFLKNNDGKVIYILIEQSKASYMEIEYTTCINVEKTLYNGEGYLDFKNDFNFNIGLFNKNENDIVFINENNQYILNSLVSGYDPINPLTIYDKKNIHYSVNKNDFDYFQKNKQYKILYSNSLNKGKSQRCELTLNFITCEDEICGFCTKEENYCYDKYLNRIYIPTFYEKNFIVIPGLILGSLVLLILFNFVKCFIKGPSVKDNVIQAELPLIQ